MLSGVTYSMPVIKYRQQTQQLFAKPVFGTGDLHGMSGAYAKKMLYMLAVAGKIRRIEKGKYTCLDDAMAVAAHVTEPCYLSLWTALSIRGLTAQIPFAVEVMTSRRRFNNRIDFEGTPIIFHYIPAAMMFGYEHIVWKDNIRIAVARKEKVIIDAVYTNGLPEDAIKELLKDADVGLLDDYSKLTNDKELIHKIKEMVLCSHRTK